MAAQCQSNCYASIGVIAWNEERAIIPMLESLFQQSLFQELLKRNLRCEILCVSNGCTDRTAAVADSFFHKQSLEHPFRDAFSCRVADLPEKGKLNAWNQFVHSLSDRNAQFLFMMDADILLHRTETLWKLLQALADAPKASITVSRPVKDISIKRRRSLSENLSLSASEITGSAPAQLCAQLYCIRAGVARNIYLPKDLSACEDGFIKQVVCTEFFTHPVAPHLIQAVEGAEHTFEAYTSPLTILKNQKRQIIGQTLVHLLCDYYLKSLPLSERQQLADTLRQKDRSDPLWLKELVRRHLQNKRFFWQLYPGLISHRIKSIKNVPLFRRLKCFPAAVAGSLAALAACWMARRSLEAGSTDYWPKAGRNGLDKLVLRTGSSEFHKLNPTANP